MSEYLPGLAGVPATQSNISDIDGEKGILSYRGYPIEQLAQHSTFEETTLLLLDGKLPTVQELAEFDDKLRRNRTVQYHITDLMKTFPPSGHPMEMLQTAVASLGMFYPGNECLTGGSCEDLNYIHNMTVKIIARMGTIVAMWEHLREGYESPEPRQDLGYAENFLWMLTRRKPDPFLARILDVCLILHAEHTINASTFSVLVNGSTLASPNSVIAAAIGALSGPLHGGANQRVVQMLEEIGTPDKAEEYVDRKLANKEVIWGMGHREYKTKDPRAVILERLVTELMESRGGDINPLFEVARAVEKVCEDRLASKGVYANVDFYSGILYSEMGIPADQFTCIFAIARSAGWLAHWREQLADNRIFRPTQVYAGEPVRDYVPLNKRG
jgi:citrate synthase